MMRKSELRAVERSTRAPGQFREGIRYVRESPELRALLIFGLLGCELLLPGCRLSAVSGPASGSAQPSPAGVVQWTDVSEQVGVRFRHVNGGSGRKYMPEQMGSGGAFLDFDGDGWLDLFLVNSRPLPGSRSDNR